MKQEAKSKIQLKSILLKKSLFNIGDYLIAPDIENIDMNLELNSAIRGDAIDSIVTVKMGNLDDDSAFSVLVSMVGVFQKEGELPMSNDEFTSINGPGMIYPYVRQHLRSLSIEAGIDPIILPVINFQKLYELNKPKASK